MPMGDASTRVRLQDVVFLTSQRGQRVPCISNYQFECKNKERTRFACRTRTCHVTLTWHNDSDGGYYICSKQHNHPPHDEAIKQITHRDNLRRLSQSTCCRLLTTRNVVTNVRLATVTSRRLSTDLRFVRRVRQNKCSPKTPTDISFDDATMDAVLFHTADNSVIVFGSSQMVGNASATTLVCVDGTFSRCPRTHYQLVTCHAVCQDGFSFPFVHALLTNKKTATYVLLFQTIDEISTRCCGRNVFGRPCVTVSCDFESGIIKALGRFSCSVKCCQFHMSQAF